MGRPSLGNQARTIQQGTKVSADEVHWLEQLHGSAHKGLRAALDFYKIEWAKANGNVDYAAALGPEGEPTWEPAPLPRAVVDVELPEPAQPMGPRPVVPVDEDGTPIPCKVHKNWETISEFYDKGIKMREKRCVKCGHVVLDRAH